MCCPCRRRERPVKMPTTEASAVPAPGRGRFSRSSLEHLRLRLRYEELRAAGGRSGLLAARAGSAGMPAPVWAQTAGALPLIVGNGPAGSSYSVPIQTLLFFTALSFLPAVVLMMTGFTRIVIVLSLLRQALGTRSAPPNQGIVGLYLFLTFFVMGQTLDKVYADAYQPYSQGSISFEQALQRGESPVRGFMVKQTRQSDFSLFAKLAKLGPDVKAETAPMRVL